MPPSQIDQVNIDDFKNLLNIVINKALNRIKLYLLFLCITELKREDTEGAKSVRFCVDAPEKSQDATDALPKPHNILVSQSTDSTDSSSTTLSSILVSHKRCNTVQPRRTQQSGRSFSFFQY